VAAPLPPADTAGVLRIFRQQHGVAEGTRPRVSLQANVAGDASLEVVEVYGHTLVAAGPRFQNGRSYYSVELPTDSDEGFLGMDLRDVTGDGRAEAIVRVRRAGQAQVRGQVLSAVKEYLMAYSMDDAHRGRVFAAEVARRVGNDALANVVQPIAQGRNDVVVIGAGTATGGWSAQSYPFHDVPTPGIAPILLPWGPVSRVVYRWNGSELAPVR
jgi:hypothetical protein